MEWFVLLVLGLCWGEKYTCEWGGVVFSIVVRVLGVFLGV